MCMTAGVILGGVGVLATDTRTNLHYDDGSIIRTDRGGKIVRTGSGFVTGSGEGRLIEAVMSEALEEQPVGYAVAALVARTYERCAATLSTEMPDSDPEVTRFLALHQTDTGPLLQELDAAGNVVQEGREGIWVVTWPPELPEDDPRHQEAMGAFRDALSVARALPDILAALGGLFATAAGFAPTMSSTLDVGALLLGVSPVGPTQVPAANFARAGKAA